MADAPSDGHGCHLVVNGAYGTVEQLKKLLTKLDQASGPLEKLPLDGRFVMGEASADLKLAFGQSSITCSGKAKGEISDASLSLGLPDVAVRELGVRFNCVFPEQTVTVEELQGTQGSQKRGNLAPCFRSGRLEAIFRRPHQPSSSGPVPSNPRQTPTPASCEPRPVHESLRWKVV